MFDFPELTLYYLERVLIDLELFGLQVHCVPVLKYCLLMADKVISNKYLVISMQLKLAKSLFSLGYSSEASEIVSKAMGQCHITQAEFTSKYEELTRMRVELI